MKPSVMTRLMMAGTALAVVAAPVAVSAKDKDDDSTTVQVSAEARRMVPQDRVMATLAIEAQGKSPEKVQA